MSTWNPSRHPSDTSRIEPFEVEELVLSLCEKNLVASGGDARLGLLESVRDYGRTSLIDTLESDGIRNRHLLYFTALAEVAEPHLTGSEQQAWMDRLETEHDNLRAALDWSVMSAERVESGQRLCAAIMRFWMVRGHYTEGRAHCAALLSAGPENAGKARARTLNTAGVLAWQQGDYGAARELHEEALSIRRTLDDRRGIAVSATNLGLVASDLGDYAAAWDLHEESLHISRDMGDRCGTCSVINNLGLVAHERGDYAVARALYSECISLSRELGERWSEANALTNLGVVAWMEGDYPAARALHEEGLSIFRKLGERRAIAESLEGLAAALASLGDALPAARLWGHAERLREETGSPLRPIERHRYEQQVAAARAALEAEAAFQTAWAAGREMTMDEAIALALDGASCGFSTPSA